MPERLRQSTRAEVLEDLVIGQQVFVSRLQFYQLRAHPPLLFPILESRLCDLFCKLSMNVNH